MDSEFEQRLRRQPMKKAPGDLRAKVLSAARQAEPVRHPLAEPRCSGNGWLLILNHQLSRLLWPHPRAWAGLAAVWLLVFALNFSASEKGPKFSEKSTPPSPETIAELKQQQKMQAELIGFAEVQVADRQRFLLPRPRSERREILAT
jgi:hypothetical protein